MKGVITSMLFVIVWSNAIICAPVSQNKTFDQILEANAGTNETFQGDIIITEEQMSTFENVNSMNPKRKKRAIQKEDRFRWPGSVIPYIIDSVFTSEEKNDYLKQAMRDIEAVTCIRFVEHFSAPTDKPYLHIISDSGCWSYVGRVFYEPGEAQRLSIRRDSCMTVGIITHELMHATGAWHEQSRPDRDNYVEIHLENVHEKTDANFAKKNATEIDSRGSPYDPGSVMHYTNTAFSRNGKPTIIWKADPSKELGGQRMTASDIYQINSYYQCGTIPTYSTTSTSTKTTTTRKPTTTKSTTTTKTTPAGCKDFGGRDCKIIAGYNEIDLRLYCDDDWYRKYCPATCGVCVTTTTKPTKTTPKTTTTTSTTRSTTTKKPTTTTTTTTATTSTASPEGCKDVGGRDCKEIAGYNEIDLRRYCDDPHGAWYRKYCQKTCGTCGKTTTKPTHTSTTTSTTTIATTSTTTRRSTSTTAPQDCNDKYKSYCETINTDEKCKYSFYKSNCKKTCNSCTKTITPSAATTTTQSPKRDCGDYVFLPCVLAHEDKQHCSEMNYKTKCKQSCDSACDDIKEVQCFNFEDMESNCKERADAGECEIGDRDIRLKMKNECSKTCCAIGVLYTRK